MRLRNISAMILLFSAVIFASAKSQPECIKIYASTDFNKTIHQIHDSSSNLYQLLGVLQSNTDEYEFTDASLHSLLLLELAATAQMRLATVYLGVDVNKSKSIDPQFLWLIRSGQYDITTYLPLSLRIITYTAAVKNTGLISEMRAAAAAAQKLDTLVKGCPSE
jgi:hypothetical protein